MKRFEVPFTNPSYNDRLNGLSLQAIDIAESAALQRSIDDFMQVAVDKPTFTAEGHTFNHKRISALGSRGMLLSVYMQQAPFLSLSLEQSHVVLTAHQNNPIVEAWATTLMPRGYDDPVTELVIGEFEEESHLKSVDLDMTPAQLDEEEFREQLHQEREWQNLPHIRFGGGAWQYEEDGAIETLSDLTWIHDRVRLAIHRGFGKAAVQRFDPEVHHRVVATGQKEQKVVA